MKSFEEYIKLKVSDVPVEVPNELWQGIEARLDASAANKPSARSGNLRWMIASAVVAVLTVAGGTALYLNRTTADDEVKVATPQLADQPVTAAAQSAPAEMQPSDSPSSTPNSISESNSGSVNKAQPDVSGHQPEQNAPAPENNQNKVFETKASPEAELSKLPVLSAETIKASPIAYNAQAILVEELAYSDPKPVAAEMNFSIYSSTESGRIPLEVDFGLEGTVPEESHVVWQVNGIPMAYDKNAINHTFTSAGRYDISVVIRGSNGTSHQQVLTVNAYEGSNLEVPTTFTPNGDRINDEYTVKGINLAEFQMTIYSLQGEQIFQTKNIEEGWNGAEAFHMVGDNARFYVRVKAVGTDGEIYDINKEIIALR